MSTDSTPARSDLGNPAKTAGIVIGVALFAGLVWWGPLDGALPAGQSAPSETGTVEVAPQPPRELVVPRLKMRARVVDTGVGPDRTLRPPREPSRVGWWSGSSRPGSDTGRTVIAGHTVHTGGGALDRLKRLRANDTVEVRTQNAVARYGVRNVATYDKDELARRADQLFSTDGPARLVVVTCDDWDGSAYESNVVVVAEPLSVRPAENPSGQVQALGPQRRLPDANRH